MSLDFALNFIGIVGVALVLVAYCLLQLGKMSAERVTYSLLNLIGAVLILISMVIDWNLPAFLMEFSWALVSGYGVWKARTRAV